MGKSFMRIVILTLLIILSIGGCGTKKEPTPAQSVQNESTPSDIDMEEGNSDEAVVETLIGYYVGQIDSNFVEIAVSGFPQSANNRAFQLDEALKEHWNSLDLEEGDKVTVKFVAREEQNPILLDISK